jgi:hypothetical protein
MTIEALLTLSQPSMKTISTPRIGDGIWRNLNGFQGCYGLSACVIPRRMPMRVDGLAFLGDATPVEVMLVDEQSEREHKVICSKQHKIVI